MSAYEQPHIKFIINPNYLKEIAEALKRKNKLYTRKKISSLIGIHEDVYQRALYYGYSFSIKIYNNYKKLVLENFSRTFLFELYQKFINVEDNLITNFKEDLLPHKKIIGQYEYHPLKETEDLAEFICIMCGDGHLSEDGQTVMFSLNPVDEVWYTKYTISMICDILGLTPEDLYFHEIEDQNTLQIIIRRQAIHYSILEKGKRERDNKNGLVLGDKIKNQIGVPDFVFKNKRFIIRGLKGLYDTDGGITVNLGKRIVLNFENYSKTLLKDFHDMCKLIGINSTLSLESFQVNISESKSVRKFIRLVNPEKINEPYRRIWIGANILKKNAPLQVNKNIQKEIVSFKEIYKKKKFHYSQSNAKKLKNWIELHYNHFLEGFSEKDKDLLNCQELNQYFTEGRFILNKKLIENLLNLALSEDIYNIIKFYKDKDEVYQISKDLFQFIIDLIYYNLINSDHISDKTLLLELVERISEKLPFNILNFLRYRIAFLKYAVHLIALIREIIRRSDPKIQEAISPYYLLKYFEKKRKIVPFKYTFLRSTFIPYIKKRFPKRFSYIPEYK
ncbi:MAG: hypothetical protein EU532_10440 [Promethearchaeota archaeon]|nr:MAG: hypothetical protein EU532_10440 [Candidatus Lokiarchaeota archaeon]